MRMRNLAKAATVVLAEFEAGRATRASRLTSFQRGGNEQEALDGDERLFSRRRAAAECLEARRCYAAATSGRGWRGHELLPRARPIGSLGNGSLALCAVRK